jgi:hypothetical protein
MGRIVDPSEKRDFVGRRKEAKIHNVEIKGKGKKKTCQDNYGFKTIALTPSISNINFASSFSKNQTNT